MSVPEEYLERIRAGEDNLQVIQEFFDDIGDPDYIDNFNDLCECGGIADDDKDPEYSVSSAELSGSTLTVNCNVFFDEKYSGGGCPDMPSIAPRTGVVVYEIDIESGSMNSNNQDL